MTDRLTCGIHGRVTGICHLCADERHNRDLTAALAAKERAEAQRDATMRQLANQDDEMIALANKLAEAEKDAERLRAIAKHGWHIVRDIEGDWQVKSPRRYGAPVIVAEAMSLHLAIDTAISQERSDA